MSEVVIGARPLSGPRERAAWIVSPGFDLALLVFVPLLTLPIVAAVYLQIPILVIGGGITLTFAHYASTLPFYFWRENHPYHRKRWLAFYAGPVLVALALFLFLGFRVPHVVQFILFFWNTFHVARQNCGILSIYRVGSGVTGPDQRNAANRAILAVSTFAALWNIGTHREVMAIFNLVSADLSAFVRAVLGVAAVVSVGHLAVVLRRRIRNGGTVGLPESLFLLASLTFFYPYFFIRDSKLATFAMLLPHYVQYMAIVWLLHRRKFRTADRAIPTVLQWMSRRIGVLIPMLFTAGFTFYVLRLASERYGNLHLFDSIFLLVAFEHFYMDGLIWSFRQQHVRETIGKYLRPSLSTA